MKIHLVLVLFGLTAVAGCATVYPAPAEIAFIPLTKNTAFGVRVESARIAWSDDHLVVSGTIRKTNRSFPVYDTHLDVQFADARGKEIELQTRNLNFRHSRFGSPPPASFTVSLDSWPAGTAEVIITPHRGRHPSTPAT